MALTSVPAAAQGDPPGPEDVERSRQQEREHADSVAGLTARLADVRSRLDDLQDAADDAVLDYAAEAARLEEARRDRASTEKAAENAADRHEGARSEAAGYAVSAYKGADLGAAAAWNEPDGPTEVLRRHADLGMLAGHQDAVLDRASASRVAAGTLDDRAAKAVEEQQDATEAARDAKEEALDAVADQRDEVAAIAAEQTELERRLAKARDNTDELEDRHAAALENATQAASGDGADGAEDAGGADGAPATGDDAACTSTEGATAGHDNGAIPESALCPLPQSGERLRADAAAAFIRLDGEFREAFGRPMCVTDSYRPFSEQVQLFHEKGPGQAANPGTSTHGKGIAVDLCGGVNRLGSPEHTWMLTNAPDHGWHNPPWARDGFEPWHWEYEG